MALHIGFRADRPMITSFILAAAALFLHRVSNSSTDGVSVRGPQLIYEGRPITLRGVCVGDVVLARHDRPDDDDYRAISEDWHANCVRIGVAPTTWRNANKAAVLNILRTEVRLALKHQMFVVIDWHAISWPNGYVEQSGSVGDAQDLYDGDFALATDFWRQCATEFAREPCVIFQLWCEPVYNATDFNTPPGSTWPILKPFFAQLTQTIRSTGAQNVVLATGNQWAYDLVGIKEDPLPDKNTGYMWHVYGGHDGNDPTKWDKKLADLQTVAPVIVTEWGFEANTTEHFKGTEESFGRPFLKFMEDRQLHWIAWCWHNTWTPAMLENDWHTPTDYGRFIKRSLEDLNLQAIRPSVRLH